MQAKEVITIALNTSCSPAKNEGYSCMNIYAYSFLKVLSNRPEPVLKQQSPCSNHEIHVPFEYGF